MTKSAIATLVAASSAACRQRGVSRTQFYEYRRSFQEQGLVGLNDLPPIHKTHPRPRPLRSSSACWR